MKALYHLILEPMFVNIWRDDLPRICRFYAKIGRTSTSCNISQAQRLSVRRKSMVIIWHVAIHFRAHVRYRSHYILGTTQRCWQLVHRTVWTVNYRMIWRRRNRVHMLHVCIHLPRQMRTDKYTLVLFLLCMWTSRHQSIHKCVHGDITLPQWVGTVSRVNFYRCTG